MPPMATHVRAVEEARRRWQRQQLELGNELRTARQIRNITLRELAATIGVSRSQLCRRELGKARMSGEQLAVHAAAVGLRLSVKLWPIGGGVRDAAQARYIAAFVARVGRLWR